MSKEYTLPKSLGGAVVKRVYASNSYQPGDWCTVKDVDGRTILLHFEELTEVKPPSIDEPVTSFVHQVKDPYGFKALVEPSNVGPGLYLRANAMAARGVFIENSDDLRAFARIFWQAADKLDRGEKIK